MRNIILIICILFSGSIMAQENTEITQFNSTLVVGEVFNFGNKTLEFKEVISDSRCPKGVTCIRAGEARVRVAIYENNKFIEEKIVSTVETNISLPFFDNTAYSIPALELLPYPSIDKSPLKQDYSLRLRVKTASRM